MRTLLAKDGKVDIITEMKEPAVQFEVRINRINGTEDNNASGNKHKKGKMTYDTHRGALNAAWEIIRRESSGWYGCGYPELRVTRIRINMIVHNQEPQLLFDAVFTKENDNAKLGV